MEKSDDGVADAKRAAAESRPFFPQSYELTPHWRRIRGTCIVIWIRMLGWNLWSKYEVVPLGYVTPSTSELQLGGVRRDGDHSASLVGVLRGFPARCLEGAKTRGAGHRLILP